MALSTLDDLIAFNDQLAALSAAGVPLDFGRVTEKDLPATLGRINAAVARRVSRGASLEDAIEEDDAAPAWYRCLVLTGMRSGDAEAALDASNRVAEAVDTSRYTLGAALVYPFIVCLLAFVGAIAFCLFLVPVLQRSYEGLEIQSGAGLTVVTWLRETLPYWVALPLVALLIWAVWRLATASRRGLRGRQSPIVAWSPGLRRSIADSRWASFADSLAGLLDQGMPLEEALSLAGCGDGPPVARTSVRDGRTEVRATNFPPFLRWAIFDAEPAVGRGRALRTAAAAYRHAAQLQADRSRLIAPMLATIVIGGSVTLLYGLMLFVPVVQMLRALATSY